MKMVVVIGITLVGASAIIADQTQRELAALLDIKSEENFGLFDSLAKTAAQDCENLY